MKSVRTRFAAVAVFSLFLAWAQGAEKTAAPSLGLTVVDGQLLREGRPYRGVGANYFNLFARSLARPDDDSGRRGLARLARAGIPFVRFMCGGYWPVENELYLHDKEAYFRRLDEVVRTAEAERIGLIPSLFWHASTVSDMVGEPLDQLGNPQSKTAAFIRQYTTDVVARYKNSPAVWGWEFGNEYNLGVDLPNAAQQRPPVHPRLKTALARSARDELRSAHMLTALGEFARTARRCDSARIILSGHTVPRASAYHNTLERTWKTDAPAQFFAVLARDNPAPIDTYCVHLYWQEKGPYSGGAGDLPELVTILQRQATTVGRPLFIGEFGAARQANRAEERAQFEKILTAIETSGAPLAAFWVFDLSSQDAAWNVAFDNDRAYMIELVAAANRRMQAQRPAAPRNR